MLLNILKEKIKKSIPGLIKKKMVLWGGNMDITNINLDLTQEKQPRVLISYISLKDYDFEKTSHANYMHLNQMIHFFCQKDFCVDVCRCDDNEAYERLNSKKYDILIGFGKPFVEFAKNGNIPIRVYFITENNPKVVRDKYRLRYEYFKTRHPRLNKVASVQRDDCYDEKLFYLAPYAIHMSSLYNASSLREYFDKVWTINANAIINNNYQFNSIEVKKWIPSSRKNFLWFGSVGLIHKGVDILLDVFAAMPDCKIDFYGLDEREKKLFRKLRPRNAYDCGRINVLSNQFVDDVLKCHNFVVFPSCSEGMSTAICTCMAHGIIPIVTKESGFDPAPSIVELDGYKVEDVRSAIEKALSLPDDKILQMRQTSFEYARNYFSLRHFDRQFSQIMNEILD